MKEFISINDFADQNLPDIHSNSKFRKYIFKHCHFLKFNFGVNNTYRRDIKLNEKLFYFNENSFYTYIRNKVENGEIFNDENRILSLLDFDLAMIEFYEKGFFEGYYKFETEIEHTINFFNISDKVWMNKVFQFCVLESKTSRGVNTSEVFSHINGLDRKEYLKNEDLYSWGEKNGKLYRAWLFIIEHFTLFEPFIDLDLLEESKENEFKEPSEDELSKFSRQSKLLILHFLGLNLRELQQPPLNQKKLKILLTYVIGRDESNIKRSLGNINEDKEGDPANPFRNKNLKEVKKIFEDLKLFEYSSKVNDIIKKKR